MLAKPLIHAAALLALALGLSTPALAVFGGKPVAEGDLVARSLAAILYRDGTGAHLCTATALGPRLMLTAAHCTDGGKSNMKVIFSTTLTDVPNAQLRDVSTIARAGKTPEAAGSFAYNNPDDVALIVLAAPAPGNTIFATFTDGDGTGKVRIAGYGGTSDLRNPGFGKAQLGFDGALRAATTTLAAKGPVLQASQSGGAGMCTGDSGGPAFTVAGKALRIAGVLIGVSAPRTQNDYCRGSAHFISIQRWHDWIVETATTLGQPINP